GAPLSGWPALRRGAAAASAALRRLIGLLLGTPVHVRIRVAWSAVARIVPLGPALTGGGRRISALAALLLIGRRRLVGSRLVRRWLVGRRLIGRRLIGRGLLRAGLLRAALAGRRR